MKNSKKTLEETKKLRHMWKKKIDPKTFPRFIKKICKDCKKEDMCQWQHSFTRTGLPVYRARCVACHKIYLSNLRKTRRKTLNKQKKERSRNIKQKCINHLGGACIKCGYNKSLFALTFHHRNPKIKEKDLAIMIQNLSFNNVKLKRELAKCDLLCFNCHMELHGETNV